MASSDDGKLSTTEKLLVLGLVRQGLSQTQIAAALGMHQTSLSRAFPKGLLAEVSRTRGKLSSEEFNGQ